MAPKAAAKFVFNLPTSVVSPTDVARLVRELDLIDSFFRQNEIRQAGQQAALSRMSKLLDQCAAENQLNMLQEEHRQAITAAIKSLHESAPVVHMSFSIDPPGTYIQKIVGWMRQNINPAVLVTVGLQPTIGAGCIVRTTNQIFDFSLREYFSQKREFFISKMHEAVADAAVAENTSVSTPPQVAVAAAPQAQTNPVEAAKA
jgi:F0F1-type ATP synthase delta subunit